MNRQRVFGHISAKGLVENMLFCCLHYFVQYCIVLEGYHILTDCIGQTPQHRYGFIPLCAFFDTIIFVDLFFLFNFEKVIFFRFFDHES